MDTSLYALLVPALVAGLAGLAVPRLVASVPEPVQEPVLVPDALEVAELASESRADLPSNVASETSGDLSGDPVVEAEPKELFVDIAARSGLGWKSALTAAFFGAVIGHGIGWQWALLPWVVAVPVCVALGVIDWRTKLLPNHLMLPLIAVITPLVLAIAVLDGGWDALVRTLACGVGAYLFYFVLWFINSAGLGFGDVRLSWVLGLLLGLIGVSELLFGLWVGFFLGGVLGLLMGGLRGARKRRIPFGPFMLLGAVLGVLYGSWALSSLVA